MTRTGVGADGKRGQRQRLRGSRVLGVHMGEAAGPAQPQRQRVPEAYGGPPAAGRGGLCGSCRNPPPASQPGPWPRQSCLWARGRERGRRAGPASRLSSGRARLPRSRAPRPAPAPHHCRAPRGQPPRARKRTPMCRGPLRPVAGCSRPRAPRPLRMFVTAAACTSSCSCRSLFLGSVTWKEGVLTPPPPSSGLRR